MTRRSGVTLADVAKKAGVSTATVSRLINGIGPISDETDERVREAIRELNYSPRRKRRRRPPEDRGRNRRTPIAFVRVESSLNRNRHPVTDTLVDALNRCAQAMNCDLTVHYTDNLDEQAVWQMVGNAKGVLLRTPPGFPNETKEIVDWLDGLPTVQVLGEHSMSRFWTDQVRPDNIQAGVLAAEYLMDSGCERVIFGCLKLRQGSVGMERAMSFARRACDAGLKVFVVGQFVPEVEQTLKREFGGLDVECLVKASRAEYIQEIESLCVGKTGLFVPTDLELAMILPQIQMLGVHLGSNLVPVDCDREIRCLSGLDPMPATMDLHLDNIAERSIRRLIHRIKYPHEPLVRMSVGPELVKPTDVMDTTVANPQMAQTLYEAVEPEPLK